MYFIAKGLDFKSQEANCFFSKLADIGNSKPTDLKNKGKKFMASLRPYHQAPVIYGRMGRKVQLTMEQLVSILRHGANEDEYVFCHCWKFLCICY